LLLYVHVDHIIRVEVSRIFTVIMNNLKLYSDNIIMCYCYVLYIHMYIDS